MSRDIGDKVGGEMEMREMRVLGSVYKDPQEGKYRARLRNWKKSEYQKHWMRRPSKAGEVDWGLCL